MQSHASNGAIVPPVSIAVVAQRREPVLARAHHAADQVVVARR